MNNLTELEILVNKWRATGLLEGLTIWKQMKLAQLLNDGANLLIARSKTDSHNVLLAVLVLPAIAHKFRNFETNFSAEEVINQVETQLPTLQSQLDKLKDVFPNTWQKYEQALETGFINELFDLK